TYLNMEFYDTLLPSYTITLASLPGPKEVESHHINHYLAPLVDQLWNEIEIRINESRINESPINESPMGKKINAKKFFYIRSFWSENDQEMPRSGQVRKFDQK
ncbi:28666_t:CDS:1, partial [Dentiscutata erythropus]